MSSDSPGERFLTTRLETLAPGSVVVFDLDNTVFDTRPRTLAAAAHFDRDHGSDWFATMTLDDVRRDGRATALDFAGLPDFVIAAFGAWWDDYFWRPDSARHDTSIASIVGWAQAARARDLDVRYLTGRIAYLHDASFEALARIGLEPAAGQLVCKPDLSFRTAPWKCDVLGTWCGERAIGWFITEGRRDLAHLQRTRPDTAGVLLDCSFESLEIVLRDDTPILPRAF